jgi:adenine C2-methylase RlmN of 23S rRNA A2503 and tRNA A37
MTTPESRSIRIPAALGDVPAYRRKQAEDVLFSPTATSWDDAQALPKPAREALKAQVPWMSVKLAELAISAKKDTHKVALELADGARVESVLMQNRRGWWTICVSSQVGCAMRCTFCATGKMGLKRNMLSDEIVDQYRFWQEYLRERPELPQLISNIVFMGMGEPLANYVNVRDALNTLFAHTELGPTNVTVSTVGVLPRLQQLLDDPTWPPVRIAVSLHSAVPETRKEIVPTSFDNFLPQLAEWTHKYFEKFDTRSRHLTFEYVMLGGVNDTPKHAQALAAFVQKCGKVKVNLIPYNFTDSEFERSKDPTIQAFMDTLEASGVIVTRRKTMGDDIAAACGQLIVESKTATE